MPSPTHVAALWPQDSTRVAPPHRLADPCGAGQAETLAGRDVGGPSEVVARTDARAVDRADRSKVDRRRHVKAEARRGAGHEHPVAQRRFDAGRGGAEPRGGADGVADGEFVGDGGAREQGRGGGQQDQRDQRAIHESAAPQCGRPTEPSAQPETAEEAGRGEREEPGVGRLERRQQGLGPHGLELLDQPDDRWQEEEDGADPEPDHRGERPATARDRRPDSPDDRNEDRERERQPDEDVQRAARPVREDDERGRHRPARHEGGTDQSQFEPADPHVRESTGRAAPGPSPGHAPMRPGRAVAPEVPGDP